MSSIDLVRANNTENLEGFFDYLLYTDPGGDALAVTLNNSSIPKTAITKTGYGTYFEPWDWVIFNSVNLDEIAELKQSISSSIVIPTLLVIITLSLLVTLISISITRPLPETILQIEQISGQKISEESLDDIPRDELGDLARSFNQMLSRMRHQAKSESQLEEKLRQHKNWRPLVN